MRADLHVVRLDLLPQVFRRPAHHQPRKEHGQDHEDQHAVQARAHAAEDHLAQLHVDQRDQPAQRREGVVHRVHRAAGGVRGHGGEQGGGKDPEADLLPLHVPVGRIHPQRVQPGVSRSFRPPAEKQTRQEQDGHRAPHRPAVLLVLHHASQVIGEAARDQKDREDLQEIGQGRRVLVRVGGVGVRVPAPVGPEHLDRHLRGHRPLHDGLRLHDLFFRDRVPLLVLDRLPLGVHFRGVHGHRLDEPGAFIRLEVLDHPLGNQEDRVEEAQRGAAGTGSSGPGPPGSCPPFWRCAGRCPARAPRPRRCRRRRR